MNLYRKITLTMFGIVAILSVLGMASIAVAESSINQGENPIREKYYNHASLVVGDFLPYSKDVTEDGKTVRKIFCSISINRTNQEDKGPYTLTIDKDGVEALRQNIDLSSDDFTNRYMSELPISEEVLTNDDRNVVVHKYKASIFREDPEGERRNISSLTYEGSAWLISNTAPNFKIVGTKERIITEHEKRWGIVDIEKQKKRMYITIKNMDDAAGFHGIVYVDIKYPLLKTVKFQGVMGPGEERDLFVGEEIPILQDQDWQWDDNSPVAIRTTVF